MLGCDARGLARCDACAAGARSRCERITSGHLAPGLQTGYCADTGGGWSGQFVAHRSQLFAVPDALPDERAVLIEPLACAIHAVRRAAIAPGERVLVVGAGAIGLLTVLALRALTDAGEIMVAAKYPKQRALATAFGATQVIAPASWSVGSGGPPGRCGSTRSTARRTCSAGSTSPSSALAAGSMPRCGSPAPAAGSCCPGCRPSSPDLTALWFRELSLVGAYAAEPG